MKICVLVKEVPDAAVASGSTRRRGGMDRSGERNLNPYDTHAIEAAMQMREGGAVEVEEIVAVTMGPESAVRALHKAVSLGADRSVHLCDDGARRLGRRRDRLRAGAGARAREPRPGAARPAVRRRRVLHGRRGRRRPPADAVADAGDQARRRADGALRCERQAEYGYDTVEVELPGRDLGRRRDQRAALPVAEGDHGRQEEAARHASRRRDVGIDAARSAARARRRSGSAAKAPPAKAAGRDHRGRGHRRDGRADRRLARREEADLMADILVYALHYEGAFNKNSLGAVSEGARLARRARRRGARGRARRRRAAASCARRSATTAPTKVLVAEGPEGLAQPVVDAMAAADRRATATPTRCSAAACSASRSAPASPRGSAPASRWRSPRARRGRRADRRAPDPRRLGDLRDRVPRATSGSSSAA